MTDDPAPPLLAGLFDDAAIFPPGNAAVPAAVAAHRRHEQAVYGAFVGPFVCTDARLGELAAALASAPAARRLPLRVVVTGGAEAVAPALEAVAARAQLALDGVEVAPRYDTGDVEAAVRGAVAALAGVAGEGTPAFVEVPRGAAAAAALDVIAGSGLRAKLRTGGETAGAHPGEREVAAFVRGCVDRRIAFKCTAGLHHAVRHTERDTGFEQHGFLNVVLAVDRALAGGTVDDLAGVLAERDPRVVLEGIRALGEGGARAARRWFNSFGTCSITEPVEDLRALGLFEAHPQPSDEAGARPPR